MQTRVEGAGLINDHGAWTDMAQTKTPPWKKKRPAGKRREQLSPSQKKRARAAANKAGRRYPNLVDNMRVARKNADEASGR
ncbi:MAG TPA: hypothetical protein VGK56_01390 [Anaerolineales bacterium]